MTGIGPVSRCSSCRARVVWATTARGERIPLEPDPHTGGNVTVYRDSAGELVAAVVSGPQRDGMRAAGRPLYRTHFIDCPDAGNWRKVRK